MRLKIDENRNRRYVTADNVASFTPHRREVVPLATEFADKELGQLCFFDKEKGELNIPTTLVGSIDSIALISSILDL